jgi:quercetin dioxygenase-like cupin family protein
MTTSQRPHMELEPGKEQPMTVTTIPAEVSTSTGAALPLVALPRTELLTLNEQNLPLVRDVFGEGVHAKLLRIDIEAGCWVLLATFSPGAVVPLHYHTGCAEVYTLAGRWHYREYPDQVQTAGSYLYEPSGSVHTFICPESNTEDTVILVRVEGANVNFTEDGQFHSILDATLIQFLIPQLAEAQGLGSIEYIGGGRAGLPGSNGA